MVQEYKYITVKSSELERRLNELSECPHYWKVKDIKSKNDLVEVLLERVKYTGVGGSLLG